MIVCFTIPLSISLNPCSLGCCLLYLPPYSPDFNPIEEAFSSMKAFLCCNWGDMLLMSVVHHITPEMAGGWFADSGYVLWSLNCSWCIYLSASTDIEDEMRTIEQAILRWCTLGWDEFLGCCLWLLHNQIELAFTSLCTTKNVLQCFWGRMGKMNDIEVC